MRYASHSCEIARGIEIACSNWCERQHSKPKVKMPHGQNLKLVTNSTLLLDHEHYLATYEVKAECVFLKISIIIPTKSHTNIHIPISTANIHSISRNTRIYSRKTILIFRIFRQSEKGSGISFVVTTRDNRAPQNTMSKFSKMAGNSIVCFKD